MTRWERACWRAHARRAARRSADPGKYRENAATARIIGHRLIDASDIERLEERIDAARSGQLAVEAPIAPSSTTLAMPLPSAFQERRRHEVCVPAPDRRYRDTCDRRDGTDRALTGGSTA
jgi:hypothetical protein